MHLHPKIVKEDAFLRLDAVSPTCGQVEFRFWFSKIERNSLDLENGEESSGNRGREHLMKFEALTLSLWLKKTCRIPSMLESQKSSNRFLNEGGATPCSHPKNLISSSSEKPSGGWPVVPVVFVASEEQIPVKLLVRAKILYRPKAARRLS